MIGNASKNGRLLVAIAFLPMLVTTRALRRAGQVNRLVRWVAPRPANDAVQAAAPLREGSIPTSFCVASKAILESFFEKGICIAKESPMRPTFRDLGQRWETVWAACD